MKRVILSFDYEIYFDGRNDYGILLSNTEKILDLAAKHGFKLVFFIDAGYLYKLKSTAQLEVFDCLNLQMKSIASKGHELHFHFHPHWINAIYDAPSNHWTFDKTEYSFNHLIQKYNLNYAKEWFNNFYKLYVELTGEKSIAYRAGGLSINHYQKEYIETLIEHEFKFDSSVMPGIKLNGEYIFADHSSAEDADRWPIDPDNGFFKSAVKGQSSIEEVPVMTVKNEKISLGSRIKASINYRLINFFASKRPPRNGDTFDHGDYSSSYPTSITFDGSCKQDVFIMKHFTLSYFKEGKKLLCMLSHPKSFVSESFVVFERYLKWLRLQRKISVVGFKELN